MRIQFIHLCGPYTEGFTYRENLLSKYLSHHAISLEIITTKDSIDRNNKINNDDVFNQNSNNHVTRLDYNFKFLGYSLFSRIRSFKKLKKELNEFNPDLIYVNSLQFFDLFVISRYKRNNPSLILLGELNATKENSASSLISKIFLHKMFYRLILKANLRTFDKVFYGSEAARDFSSNLYHLPVGFELLPLAVDDDMIEEVMGCDRIELKYNYGFELKDFVIVTGGKIDDKKKTIELINAFKSINNMLNLKLVVFGSVSEDLESKFYESIQHDKRISYLGWLNDIRMYELFRISDIAVFAGSKSAIWESAIAMGLPLVAQYWDGMDYINFGSNVRYLHKNGDINEIKTALANLIEDEPKRSSMSRNASANWKNALSYKLLAEKIIHKYNELKEEQP